MVDPTVGFSFKNIFCCFFTGGGLFRDFGWLLGFGLFDGVLVFVDVFLVGFEFVQMF